MLCFVLINSVIWTFSVFGSCFRMLVSFFQNKIVYHFFWTAGHFAFKLCLMAHHQKLECLVKNIIVQRWQTLPSVVIPYFLYGSFLCSQTRWVNVSSLTRQSRCVNVLLLMLDKVLTVVCIVKVALWLPLEPVWWGTWHCLSLTLCHTNWQSCFLEELAPRRGDKEANEGTYTCTALVWSTTMMSLHICACFICRQLLAVHCRVRCLKCGFC